MSITADNTDATTLAAACSAPCSSAPAATAPVATEASDTAFAPLLAIVAAVADAEDDCDEVEALATSASGADVVAEWVSDDAGGGPEITSSSSHRAATNWPVCVRSTPLLVTGARWEVPVLVGEADGGREKAS